MSLLLHRTRDTFPLQVILFFIFSYIFDFGHASSDSLQRQQTRLSIFPCSDVGGCLDVLLVASRGSPSNVQVAETAGVLLRRLKTSGLTTPSSSPPRRAFRRTNRGPVFSRRHASTGQFTRQSSFLDQFCVQVMRADCFQA